MEKPSNNSLASKGRITYIIDKGKMKQFSDEKCPKNLFYEEDK